MDAGTGVEDDDVGSVRTSGRGSFALFAPKVRNAQMNAVRQVGRVDRVICIVYVSESVVPARLVVAVAPGPWAVPGSATRWITTVLQCCSAIGYRRTHELSSIVTINSHFILPSFSSSPLAFFPWPSWPQLSSPVFS